MAYLEIANRGHKARPEGLEFETRRDKSAVGFLGRGSAPLPTS